MSDHDGKDVARLTDEQSKRAADWIHLAEACAVKASQKWTYDYDTLLSVAYEGLVRAAGRWDASKSPTGEGGWGPFAVQHINWWLLRINLPNSKMRHNVIAIGEPLPEYTEAIVDTKQEGKDHPEDVSYEITKRMKRLNAMESAVLIMRSKGYTHREIGDVMGYTRSRAEQIEKKAKKKAAWPFRRKMPSGKWSITKWVESNPNKYQKALRRAHHEGGRASKVKSLLRKKCGEPYPRSFYVVNDRAKTLTGPYQNIYSALGQKSKCMTGAAFGWIEARPTEGQVLKLIDENEVMTMAKLARATGRTVADMSATLHRLSKRGFIEHRGRTEKGVEVRVVQLWGLSDKARSLKRPPVIVRRGKDCLDLTQAGYRLELGVDHEQMGTESNESGPVLEAIRV